MFTLILLLLSLFFIPIYLLCLKNTKSSNDLVPPGPPRLPFVGNLHQLDSSCLHKCLWELSKKFGPLMSLQLGSIPTLVVSSSRLAREVLKEQDRIFCSIPQKRSIQILTYGGLDMSFAPHGPNWKEVKIFFVLHLLGGKRIKQCRPIREDELSRIMEKIRKDAQSCNVTNLSKILRDFAYCTTSRVTFGKRWEEESYETTQFDYLLHEAEAMLAGFFFSDYFPSLGWVDRLTGMHSRLENIFKSLDAFYEEVIDEHLDPNRPNSMDDDSIDVLLKLQQSGTTSFDITMDHIKAITLDLLLAGKDTYLIAVTWAMTALMKNPNVMRKLQAEIRGVMKQKESLDEDDIENLPYLKETVMETLRLYTVGPLMAPRETLEKCNLEGYEIQPKTTVYVNAWGIARDPEVWEFPEEFLPERFFASNIDKEQDIRMPPFGLGRRSCPGSSLALLIVQLLLANLVHVFDWELPPGMKEEDLDTESLPGLFLIKKNDLKLVPKFHASSAVY